MKRRRTLKRKKVEPLLQYRTNEELRTWTWRNRNDERIKTVITVLNEKKIISPSIIQIWPWAITSFPDILVPKGPIEWWSSTDELFSRIEKTLRKKSKKSLKNFETNEIITELTNNNINVDEFTIVDIEKKVIDATKSSLSTVKNPIIDIMEYKVHDVLEKDDWLKASIIFCHHVIQRIDNPELALKNIAWMLKVWWYLSLCNWKNSIDDFLHILWDWYASYNWLITKI